MTDRKKTVGEFARLLIEEGYLEHVPVQWRNQALLGVVQLRKHSDVVFDALEDLVGKWAKAKETAAELQKQEGKSNDESADNAA